ncbi:unnamed protein product [Schistosoma mattheei]|uniref:Uncharacterized protein n=1 Tax=Schistosoma mattheei TaxID=31246 RepID=A0A183PU25_9TREM|nr:unnamed protein product [Schistosoma mattheei]
MVVGGSQQKTLDPGFVLLGTRQQGVPGGFDLVSPSFTPEVCADDESSTTKASSSGNKTPSKEFISTYILILACYSRWRIGH